MSDDQGLHAVGPTRRVENDTNESGRCMFESFEEALINVGETTVFTRHKGNGPPLLPLAIWRNWADSVSGRAIERGHFFPEHNPAETIAELEVFFRA